MANVSYTPTFHHFPWRNRLDRVEAAGTNGFNVRFAAIEHDLHQVSTVVSQIGAEIDRIRVNVNASPREHRLAFTPTLQAVPPAPPWSTNSPGFLVLFGRETSDSFGLVNLDLRNGSQLTSLAVNYTAGPGPTDLSFVLLRTPLRVSTGPAPTDTLAEVKKSHLDSGIFHLSKDVNPAFAQVDLDHFRYFVTAKGRVSSFFTLSTFELTYFA